MFEDLFHQCKQLSVSESHAPSQIRYSNSGLCFLLLRGMGKRGHGLQMVSFLDVSVFEHEVSSFFFISFGYFYANTFTFLRSLLSVVTNVWCNSFASTNRNFLFLLFKHLQKKDSIAEPKYLFCFHHSLAFLRCFQCGLLGIMVQKVVNER